MCREVVLFSAETGLQRVVYRVVAPPEEAMPVEPVNGARGPEAGGGQTINRGSAARGAGMAATRWCHGPGRGEQGPMKKPSSGGLLSQQPE